MYWLVICSFDDGKKVFPKIPRVDQNTSLNLVLRSNSKKSQTWLERRNVYIYMRMGGGGERKRKNKLSVTIIRSESNDDDIWKPHRDITSFLSDNRCHLLAHSFHVIVRSFAFFFFSTLAALVNPKPWLGSLDTMLANQGACFKAVFVISTAGLKSSLSRLAKSHNGVYYILSSIRFLDVIPDQKVWSTTETSDNDSLLHHTDMWR